MCSPSMQLFLPLWLAYEKHLQWQELQKPKDRLEPMLQFSTEKKKKKRNEGGKIFCKQRHKPNTKYSTK